MRRLLAAALVLLGVAAGAQAPEFDVVSIKLYAGRLPPQAKVNLLTVPAQGGEMRGSPTTAVGLILVAFRDKGIMRADQVIGFPSWADSTRFEFLGTVDHSMSRETLLAQLPAMLRGTLENRFRLKAHIEQRSTPVYALVVARADGRLGPAVKESAAVDCEAATAKFRETLKGLSSPEVIARLKAMPMPCSTSSAPGRIGGACGSTRCAYVRARRRSSGARSDRTHRPLRLRADMDTARRA